MFAKGSRYEAVPDAVYTDPSGRETGYKRLRLIPAAPALQVHTVRHEERLDLIAFLYYTDPEQFWRICDANVSQRPEDLEEAGRRLLIPLAVR